ncbi:cytochrome P450 [Actinoallomurus bryophytorum]|uniref:Cytochrome P450 n=1 Tax=Actinoallomurus bryophytorum TaxID=1490222 RepID=A0A543CUU4_9ACTN|nr:cytochrome P450 [Actinoallomurus bryophytorum]
MRAQGPAVLVELPGPVHAWSVTRYNVIQALTRDPRVSRDARRHWPGLADVPEGWPLAPIVFMQSFFNAYGEEHRRFRHRIAPSFSPRRVAQMRPQIQATADHLVEALAALPPGTTVDVRQGLALPLAMTVICDLFGVPDHMRGKLGAAIHAVLDPSVDPEQAVAIQAEVHSRFTELLRYKREHPAADLASDLLRSAEAGEEPMPEPVLLDTLFLVIGAGYETAVNLITSAVGILLADPGSLARVREGTIGWQDIVEESLRYEGPAMHMPMRFAIEDIDLGEGVVIRKGDPIIIGFAAAGRDPEVHPHCPESFDPTRASKEHLAFGDGPHFCLGAHLGRLETEIALATLFTRLPDLALARPGDQPARLPSFVANGLADLNVVPHPV